LLCASLRQPNPQAVCVKGEEACTLYQTSPTFFRRALYSIKESYILNAQPFYQNKGQPWKESHTVNEKRPVLYEKSPVLYQTSPILSAPPV